MIIGFDLRREEKLVLGASWDGKRVRFETVDPKMKGRVELWENWGVTLTVEEGGPRRLTVDDPRFLEVVARRLSKEEGIEIPKVMRPDFLEKALRASRLPAFILAGILVGLLLVQLLMRL